MNDRDWLTRALELARLGLGRTWPNPAVGAVLVKDGEVVAEGWHQRAGEPHAEQLALEAAGAEARGCTLYVTLEPCCHEGRPRTPCSRQTIEAGVSRVVVGLVDPYPAVCGQGIAQLREAGIEVEMAPPDLQWECARLNRAFLHFVHTGRPLVTLKYAASLDGKIATRTGHSQWISGSESRAWVHRQRAQSQAVLVGLGTVLADDPQLNARLDEDSPQPLRLVADRQGRTPPGSRLFHSPGGEVVLLTERLLGEVTPAAILDYLAQRKVQSLLLEGGATLNAAFLEAGCVNHVAAFLAPILIGGKEAPGPLGGMGAERLDAAWALQKVESRGVGNDLLVEGYLNCPWLI